MATWLSGISKQHRIIRKNVFLWYGCFLGIFLLILLRLFWLQGIEGRYYRQIADRYHTRVVELRAKRGQLLDRNMTVLALDDQRQSLFVDPSLVQYPDFIAQQLAPVLQVPENELLAKLTQQDPYVDIKTDLTSGVANSVRQLNLPGVIVRSAGERFRIGLDLQKIPLSAGIAEELADALGVPAKDVKSQLGELTPTPADENGKPDRPEGQRWLNGSFPTANKDAAIALHFPGLLYEKVDDNFSVGVDPREYLGKKSNISAEDAAASLAPAIGMDQSTVERLLQYRPRFVMLKTDLSEDMLTEVHKLQGSMFVVKPGLLSDAGKTKDGEGVLSEAVGRICDMLNGKKGPQLVTEAQVRDRLATGAAPGLLATKLDKGQPDIMIQRRLFAKPVNGVIYGLPGVGLMQEPRRHYLYGTLASATLGWVGDVRVHPSGAFGLELSEEKQLRGIDGKEIKEIDARRRTIPERSERTEPINGHDVVLTMDLTIQQAAEEELAKAVQSARALQGECIVMDPNTGEILAMATYPSWDANKPGESPIPLVNPAISNFYEPGSTFKVVPVISSLEEKLIRDGEKVTYCSGAMSIGRNVIHESHNAHGAVDCGRLLEQSCNIGAAFLALKLGPERFLNWCEKFGFGKQTGIELANESPGSLNRKNVDAKITLANMGFGQSLAVTPIQMATTYSVIANGGKWIQPHLVKSLQQPDGSWKNVKVPERQVCSPETAALLRKYLQQVVDKGTGKAAAIPGYRVGGKTGTAQKPGIHGYSSGKYIGSFIGVMPIEKPRFVVIAVIDEPKGSIYGGVVAGPVVREVGRRALQYMNVPPSLPLKPEKQK